MDKPIETMYQYVMRKLRENKGRHSAIAHEVGLSGNTLHSISSGKTESPTVHNIQKLHDYFRKAGE